MKKNEYAQGTSPEVMVLGISERPGKSVCTLCLLSLPSQDLYLLFRDKNDRHSLSYITPQCAQNMLKMNYLQKTRDGEAWLISQNLILSRSTQQGTTFKFYR